MREAGGAGQQGAAPAAGAERADRGQRQEGRGQGDDRPVGGEIVGGRARRRRHQDAVADQLGQAHHVVDGDAELGRLAALAVDRDLVDADGLDRAAVAQAGPHPQRVERHPLGALDPRSERRPDRSC